MAMPLWKRCLLHTYRWGTLPWRRQWERKLRQQRRSPVILLFYHRVADSHPNGWTIGRQAFARQVHWLKEHFELLSMTEAQRRIRCGENDRPAVSITFDDGYAENCDFALPLLHELGVPCTYFVTTGNVVSQQPFPHDLQRNCPLPVNSVRQIRELVAAGIELGAHTRTHVDLGAVRDPEQLQAEIIGSQDDLQQMTGQAIRYFAFPFGQVSNLTSEAFAVCREAGFVAACSAYGGYNLPGEDPFHLQRIHGDPELVRLQNWLTFDPRKQNVKRFSATAPATVARSLEQPAPV